MKQEEQVLQGKKLLEMQRSATTALVPTVYRNPTSDYTCPRQAAKERDVLFRRYPILFGLSSRVARPGDYLTDDHTGVPILIARGKDGVLRAFVNFCRHRGARVAQDADCAAKSFTCPYHGWVYGLDGKLVGRPNDAAFDGADKASHGLVPLPVFERHGMIWVVPSPDVKVDIDGHVGPLADELANYDFGGYHHYETRELQQATNWKLVVDTFLESYHVRHLHRRTVAALLCSDLATYDDYGLHQRMIVARHTIDELRSQPEKDWNLVRYTAVVYVLFPNTVFIMQGDHAEIWHIFPDGEHVDRARIFISLYTPEPAVTDSARRHWDANLDILMAAVRDEDFPLSRNVQKCLGTGVPEDFVFGRNEPSLQHYHRRIVEALRLERGQRAG